MIWFWLSLAIISTLTVLIVGGLLVDRWWHRRKARKHAEALARFKALDPYQRLVRDFAATMTAVGEQMRPAFIDNVDDRRAYALITGAIRSLTSGADS